MASLAIDSLKLLLPSNDTLSARLLARHLQRLILNGSIEPGVQLPSQRELSEGLSISRPSLREAISTLEALGLVRVDTGKGAFVTTPEQRVPTWRFSSHCTPNDVYESRYGLEAYAASLAAMRIGNESLKRLKDRLDNMREAGKQLDLALISVNDTEFHDIIVEAANNPLISFMYRSLREELIECQHVFLIPEELDSNLREHQAIYDAIEQKNPAAAADQMRQHIAASAIRTGTDFKPHPL
ncbi:FadR/GntR family transcriptional regulator [Aestuariirhabdus litorea]|uniref:FadR family transcriptional regulator n=1 Tax=Aestuariirhabdus litorea TaxID=2528527 RepID=A0A3P3VIU2_9GAMM|nr:FadR/GntR family transcriptional regulator [Aestuariirhabdus litorea]RRJ82274.1 FadR family transcriptional regulator [Aestuariirhabdus litorea]RWW92440.1 FCD domain-containing protein [Endozoicomonadaceae bacterium GTF-13]